MTAAGGLDFEEGSSGVRMSKERGCGISEGQRLADGGRHGGVRRVEEGSIVAGR